VLRQTINLDVPRAGVGQLNNRRIQKFVRGGVVGCDVANSSAAPAAWRYAHIRASIRNWHSRLGVLKKYAESGETFVEYRNPVMVWNSTETTPVDSASEAFVTDMDAHSTPEPPANGLEQPVILMVEKETNLGDVKTATVAAHVATTPTSDSNIRIAAVKQTEIFGERAVIV
jgi:hypothetical protein